MKIEEMISAKRADCSGCEACANVCPRRCIEMTADAEGFYYPAIDHDRCVDCGQCDRTCPALNPEAPRTDNPTAFAAVNRDWTVRRQSSSGGVFSAVAEIILKRGGIVFGAAFNDRWRVEHTSAESVDELERLRGSKYVQSRIGETYRRIKRELENDRDVMFVGTPCQVAGLRHYLGREYDRLTLVDTACKGVPSPELWAHYIEHRGRGHVISEITFRDKQLGWENSLFKIIFEDSPLYSREINKDLFGQGFGLGLTLRPSCSECRFKGVKRPTDLTLADFWGVRKVLPSMFDNRGTSLVLVHSTKGDRLLRSTQLVTQPVEPARAIEGNPCVEVSFPADERRAEFFNELSKEGADPIDVLNRFYLYDYRRQAQRLTHLMSTARQALRSSAQPSENVLIVTMKWEGGGSNVFLDYRVREKYSGVGVYVLNQPSLRELVIYNYRAPDERRTIPKDYRALDEEVRRLHITRLFVNNFVTFELQFIVNWVGQAGLPYEYFVHDYLCVCPNYMIDCFGRFCAQSMTNPLCRRHFNKYLPSQAAARTSVENWRGVFGRLLSRAERVIAPSTYAAGIVKKFLPSLRVEVEPHRVQVPLTRTFRAEFASRERLRIVFLGFMRREKGEAYLLLANEFIRREGLPIELVVVGEYRDDIKNIGTREGIEVTGEYDNRATSELLSKYEAAVVAILSTTYETYCYTASEAILSGYPVLTFNIGAQALRVRKHNCGWLIPITSPSGGLKELKKFLKYIVTAEGRAQILSKAAATSTFVNGTE